MADGLSKSRRWQDRQLGVLLAVGFLTIVRYGELQRVRRDGIRVVWKSGGETTLSDLTRIPRATQVAGLLIHLAWRKSKQEADAWVPLSCTTTIQRLLDHEHTLRQLRCMSHRLFPSVSRRRGNLPHESNYFGAAQSRRDMRQALRSICRMSDEESKVYGGHSLRVGGSNYMRRLNIDPDVHRALGGWSVLKSARDYMQLSPAEQFSITRDLAVKRERELGFERRQQARTALSQVQPLVISAGVQSTG